MHWFKVCTISFMVIISAARGLFFNPLCDFINEVIFLLIKTNKTCFWFCSNTQTSPTVTFQVMVNKVHCTRKTSKYCLTVCKLCVWLCILPCPSWAWVSASLAVPKPSSLQTTLAAGKSHRWSHMVPHLPSFSTSTRPSPRRGPAFRRTTGWKKKVQVLVRCFWINLEILHLKHVHIWMLHFLIKLSFLLKSKGKVSIKTGNRSKLQTKKTLKKKQNMFFWTQRHTVLWTKSLLPSWFLRF